MMERLRKAGLTIALALITIVTYSQGILSRSVSLNVNNQSLDNVLEILSNKGNFYFSYNSNIIKKDSLVTMNVLNRTVKQVLDQLFSEQYEFKESGNYIIIRRVPIQLTFVTEKAVTDDKNYFVSGYVLDESSGDRISNASVYEKRSLASAMTNEQGYFRIKLKSKQNSAAITVSKSFYEDTTIEIQPRYNQKITIAIIPMETDVQLVTIGPQDYLIPDSLRVSMRTDTGMTEYLFVKSDSIKVEKTKVGRFLLSGKQTVQSLNLKDFFTTRPFQFSITPGLSTQGKLSSQVVNNFSLNVFGGYTGGVNGAEIGGLFNINKKSVQYFQAAGLFNIVGGHMHGFQVAGLNNTVLDTALGFQAAGINNMVKGKFVGFQVAGVHNHVSDSVEGVQIGGVGNFAKEKVKGVQIAGVANVSNREMSGVQIAGVFNYAKKMKGFQLGLINVCDTIEGVSLGLINVVIKGYHKLSFSTNEVLNINAAFKTGNRRLYSILLAGVHATSFDRAYSFGYGFGSEIKLGRTFSINPEMSSQYLYLGSWDYLNLLNKLYLNVNVKIGKYFSFFAGPSFNVYYSEQDVAETGYKLTVPPTRYNTFTIGKSGYVTGWFGWNVGVNFF